MEIKVRLLKLNKTLSQLMDEIIRRGEKKLAQNELSLFVNHPTSSPKCQRILGAAEEILAEWEKAAGE